MPRIFKNRCLICLYCSRRRRFFIFIAELWTPQSWKLRLPLSNTHIFIHDRPYAYPMAYYNNKCLKCHVLSTKSSHFMRKFHHLLSCLCLHLLSRLCLLRCDHACSRATHAKLTFFFLRCKIKLLPWFFYGNLNDNCMYSYLMKHFLAFTIEIFIFEYLNMSYVYTSLIYNILTIYLVSTQYL